MYCARMFERIAKTNTTHTSSAPESTKVQFESIAKTNTTNTIISYGVEGVCLRVLLKQIRHTRDCTKI